VDDALDLVAGADWHGRFGDDDREALQRLRDLARRLIDEGEVRVSVAAPRRRADRDEHRVRFRHRRLQLGRELQPPSLRIGRDEFGQARLVDRHLASLERIDLGTVLVDAGDLMAEIGKAGP
jgi:hypothetical protein